MRTRKIQLEAAIYVGDDADTEISLTGEYYEGCKGDRGPHGEPMTPDDDPEIYILTSFDEDGMEVELTEEQEEMARAALWEAVANY
tara:strand:+ start:13295 stop:13552 length:258 start_codon:yes stop_codon:yes gene_type:complete